MNIPFSDDALSYKKSEDQINLNVKEAIEVKKLNNDSCSNFNLRQKDLERNGEEMTLMSSSESKVQQ